MSSVRHDPAIHARSQQRNTATATGEDCIDMLSIATLSSDRTSDTSVYGVFFFVFFFSVPKTAMF